MDDEYKKRTLTRLKRVAGQVDGIQRMVEEDRYCIEVLTQIAAVQAAIGKAGEEILERHLQTCVRHAMESGDPAERDRVVEELMTVVARSSSLLR